MTLNIGTPIGTIVAWDKTLSGTPTLRSDWMECDGSLITDTDSPMVGSNVPNLNGTTEATKKFLRGIDGTTGTVSSTYQHSHGLSVLQRGASSQPNEPTTVSTVSHVPSYYEVVYVIKFK